MKQDDQSEQQRPMPAKKAVRPWLSGSVLTLLLLVLAALLLAPHLIASATVKKKIQETVAEQTGGQVDYQAIDLTYFPRPTIELRQLTLAIPNQVEGTVEALLVSPQLLPLLTGQVHLARLELEGPEFSLELPDTKPSKSPARPYALDTLEKSLASALEPLGQVVPNMELLVNNGRVSVVRGKQKLVETDGLILKLTLSVNDPRSARANLQGGLSELIIHSNGHQESIKGAKLKGNVQIAPGEITVSLDRLALTEPALELTGNLALAPIAPGITLNLSGSDIDVSATRRAALALVGNTSPTKKIFDYLRGGRVPQISVTSRGKSPSELGDLNNILIKGQLQEGKVSIPEIKLDLTEVNGDVVISEGVLQGSRMSIRLEGSTGRDGSLKVGLGEGNDLFQLELTLSADLQETQPILQRVVGNPTFIAELKKITNLQGTGHGRLVLGDSLDDITAKVEVSELKLSADYQGVPFPVSISQGQLSFSEGQVDLGKLSGKLGKSQFADLSCQFRWVKDLSLDLTSGRFGLVMTELYPWLASLKGVSEHLTDVKKVSGRIDLSVLNLKGLVDKPSEWQYATTGTVKALSVDTRLYPGTIRLAGGGFKVDAKQLTFKELQAAGLDAKLTLTGRFKGFPLQRDRVELSLDGRMGPDSVEWLRDTFKVPKTYAIHTPLNINNSQLSWQPDSTATFKGAVSIEKGPAITADVDYHPEQLQVHRATIKDQYSDVSMALDLAKEHRDFKFNGKLQHETLNALFIDRQFSSGRLEGDFAVTVPQTGQSKVTTEGHLTGKNLLVLLPSGDKVAIDQVSLNADGPQVKVDITKLSWLGLTWEPVVAIVSFDHDRTDVRISEAKLCDIDAPGVFTLAGEELSLKMNLEGKGLDVSTSYTCLTEGQVRMTGALDFSSKITARGTVGELVKALQGPLEMTFSNGVIEQNKILARALQVLNVTEIVKGRLPDLRSTGFAYTTITLQGEIQGGKLIIHKLFMDGETLDLLGNGEVDLVGDTIHVQLLAAPFKTVDSVVKKIPGVNYLLAGSLVTIPLSIKGDLADPKVRVMSASAVGSSLLGLGERIIKSPIKLMETIVPRGKD